MKEQFEVKKEHYLQKQREVDAAQREVEKAHKTVVDVQREMKAAFDEAMIAHKAKSWPVYYDKLKIYDNKQHQHETAAQTYAGLLASYESLISTLA